MENLKKYGEKMKTIATLIIACTSLTYSAFAADLSELDIETIIGTPHISVIGSGSDNESAKAECTTSTATALRKLESANKVILKIDKCTAVLSREGRARAQSMIYFY